MNIYASKKNRKITKIHNATKDLTSITQRGGVKVIIGMDTREPTDTTPPIEREVLTIENFRRILNVAVRLEVISSLSLTSFVIKVTLRHDITFFKSDMILENGQRLNFTETMDATSGLSINEIVIKICIIGKEKAPSSYRFKRDEEEKRGVDRSEFLNEYQSQRYLYSAMMSRSGNPFCPDAFGRLELSSLRDFESIFNTIKGKLSQENEFHTIYSYLVSLLQRRDHNVGLIIMESIPGNYNVLSKTIPVATQNGEERTIEIPEIICAINILTLYRGKLFLLDAHTNNWLCDQTAPILSRVKAIDLGRVYRINSETDIAFFMQSIEFEIFNYFRILIRCTPPDQMRDVMNSFFRMMCVTQEDFTRFTNAQSNIEFQIFEATRLLMTELHDIITILGGEAHFVKPFINLTPEERAISINMIHRLLMMISLVDSFHNNYRYHQEIHGKQICLYEHHTGKQIFQVMDLSNPENIFKSRILIDLNRMHDTNQYLYDRLNEKYQNVYSIIYEFCQDRKLPDNIRGYSSTQIIPRGVLRRTIINLTPYVEQAPSKMWDVCGVIGEKMKDGCTDLSYFVSNGFNSLLYNLNLKQRPKKERAVSPPMGGKQIKFKTISKKRTKQSAHYKKKSSHK